MSASSVALSSSATHLGDVGGMPACVHWPGLDLDFLRSHGFPESVSLSPRQTEIFSCYSEKHFGVIETETVLLFLCRGSPGTAPASRDTLASPVASGTPSSPLS